MSLSICSAGYAVKKTNVIGDYMISGIIGAVLCGSSALAGTIVVDEMKKVETDWGINFTIAGVLACVGYGMGIWLSVLGS